MLKHRLKRCKYCGKLISLHRRCKQCDILLHENNSEYRCKVSGVQYTLESPRVNYCMRCYEQGIQNVDQKIVEYAIQFKN